MPTDKLPPHEQILQALKQKLEMISGPGLPILSNPPYDFGVNLHRGGPVGFDKPVIPGLLSREHISVPSRVIRYFDGQSSTKPFVTMTFSMEKFNRAMKRAKKSMEKYNRSTAYYFRVYEALSHNPMTINEDEVLESIGSSLRIDYLIRSRDARKRKRGWRLYQRNHK